MNSVLRYTYCCVESVALTWAYGSTAVVPFILVITKAFFAIITTVAAVQEDRDTCDGMRRTLTLLFVLQYSTHSSSFSAVANLFG